MVLLSQSQIRHCPLAMAAPSYGGPAPSSKHVATKWHLFMDDGAFVVFARWQHCSRRRFQISDRFLLTAWTASGCVKREKCLRFQLPSVPIIFIGPLNILVQFCLLSNLHRNKTVCIWSVMLPYFTTVLVG